MLVHQNACMCVCAAPLQVDARELRLPQLPASTACPLQDSACERLAELALNDGEWAGALLRQALQPCSNAVAAIEPRVLREAAAAFQRVSLAAVLI